MENLYSHYYEDEKNETIQMSKKELREMINTLKEILAKLESIIDT